MSKDLSCKDQVYTGDVAGGTSNVKSSCSSNLLIPCTFCLSWSRRSGWFVRSFCARLPGMRNMAAKLKPGNECLCKRPKIDGRWLRVGLVWMGGVLRVSYFGCFCFGVYT